VILTSFADFEGSCPPRGYSMPLQRMRHKEVSIILGLHGCWLKLRPWNCSCVLCALRQGVIVRVSKGLASYIPCFVLPPYTCGRVVLASVCITLLKLPAWPCWTRWLWLLMAWAQGPVINHASPLLALKLC